MSEAENVTPPVPVESKLISPQTQKALVKIDARGTLDVQSLEGLQRLAHLFSGSEIVRDCYRITGSRKDNDQHLANCAIAIRASLTLGIDPLFFLQHTYVVPRGGAIAIDGQIAIAVINNSVAVDGRIVFCFDGEDRHRQCTASAVDLARGYTHTYTVTWADVVRNGWDRDKPRKDGSGSVPSQWTTQPELMFRYRSALYLARTSFPDLLMGMRTIDEQEDIDGGVGLQSGDTLPPDDLDKIVEGMATPETPEEAAVRITRGRDETPMEQAVAKVARAEHLENRRNLLNAQGRACREHAEAGDVAREKRGREETTVEKAEKRAGDLFPEPDDPQETQA